MTIRRRKVSVTLSEDLVSRIDRHAGKRETRSGVMERWLRRAAFLATKEEIEEATIAYYESLTGEERAEDEALSRSLSRAARRLQVDGPVRSRSRGRRRR